MIAVISASDPIVLITCALNFFVIFVFGQCKVKLSKGRFSDIIQVPFAYVWFAKQEIVLNVYALVMSLIGCTLV